MKKIAIVPARWASTRFPGKPLARIGGRPVIERVYERACMAVDEVYVATDDSRIADCVRGFGGRVVMTGENCRSGTERCAEALSTIDGVYDVVVNVQGDEPFIAPEQIAALCDMFTDDDTEIATLARPFDDGVDLSNPNWVKVVRNLRGEAMYFSRSPIPFFRNQQSAKDVNGNGLRVLKHVGMYAYRPDVLCRLARLDATPLEQAECLEQLRWLEHGYRIKVGLTDRETVGIDTPEDLERAEKMLINGLSPTLS